MLLFPSCRFSRLEAWSISFWLSSPRQEAWSINFAFVSQAGGSEYQLFILITGWLVGVSTFHFYHKLEARSINFAFVHRLERSEYELLALLIPGEAKQTKQINTQLANRIEESRASGQYKTIRHPTWRTILDTYV